MKKMVLFIEKQEQKKQFCWSNIHL